MKHSQIEKNRHVLEERNLKPLKDDEDEEAKYSAVLGKGLCYYKVLEIIKKFKKRETVNQKIRQAFLLV